MTTALVAISWLSNLPSFDWTGALVVGAIVAAAAAALIVIAVATPFVALQAGATVLGTSLVVSTISLATGVLGGLAAGFYWGRQGDIKREKRIEHIREISNRLDIYFHPSPEDPSRAADFRCTVVTYEERDLASPEPTVTQRSLELQGADSDAFYKQVEQEVIQWLQKPVQGDKHKKLRRVTIYMMPYPGEGVYERLKKIGERKRLSVVNRSEGRWHSALQP
jgi:hypothetical protein